ncbi:FAD:protein FMN transferase [Streptomyces sp. TR06-5]|uniref:FAD:protein FMN transferase n=1 Tax=Streptomyces sp. TR06-5 TaxID=3385976 RepID=UPI0039A26D18
MTPGTHPTGTARAAFPALGTTAAVLVTEPEALPVAESVLRAEVAAVDRACSRFRPDSELTRVNVRAGSPTTVGQYFAEALGAALHAARITDGAVDPTVGRAVLALGYDRTFASVRPDDARPLPVARPAPGWQRIVFDPRTRRLHLPPRTHLDLGATAKAHAAERAARRAAERSGCGVLVSLGGDLATAGPAPRGGWRVGLVDDHTEPATAGTPCVAVSGGALATSGVRVRTWRRSGRTVHHIVDPATGACPAPTWRTVSVAAADCVDANAAATAAVVLGERAPAWLGAAALPARLTGIDGGVSCLGGWPQDVAPLAPGGAR